MADLQQRAAQLQAQYAAECEQIWATVRQIPGYTILREVSRGGQGIVYEVYDTVNKRPAALKLLVPTLLRSTRARSRFQDEIETLARLKHPNLVTVHVSGSTQDSMYFVTDYVDGVPLDQFVKPGRCRIRETLQLFLGVCDAVGAIHREGILHRDLKPANIRVDRTGRPFVLDFGLARSLEESDRSEVTDAGQFVGTLLWGSPEQVRGDSSMVTKASDVYALGNMLYYLLVGESPYRNPIGRFELQRQIMEVEPVRPSTRRSGISGDLEAILLNCLEKNPGRRYRDAEALAGDIRALLSNRPVAARPANIWYRSRKFVARQFWGIIAAVITTVGLVGGIGVATWQAGEARAEASNAKTLSQFLHRIIAFDFRSKDSVGQWQVELDKIASDLTQSFDNRSVARAEVHSVLAQVYWRRGQQAEREAQAREAFEIYDRVRSKDDATRFDAMFDLATAVEARDENESRPVYRHLAADAKRYFGADDARSIRAHLYYANVLGDSDLATCEAILRDNIERSLRVLGRNNEITEFGLNALGGLYVITGRRSEAKAAYVDLLASQTELHGAYHHGRANTLMNLSVVSNQPEEASACLGYASEAYSIYERMFGPEHPDTLRAVLKMAIAWQQNGNLEEAECWFRIAIKGFQRLHGEGHSDTRWARNGLGRLYLEQGRCNEAETLFRAALSTDDGRSPSAFAEIGFLMNRGRALCCLGAFEEAERCLLSAFAKSEQWRGNQAPPRTEIANALVALYGAWGRPAEAAEWQMDLEK